MITTTASRRDRAAGAVVRQLLARVRGGTIELSDQTGRTTLGNPDPVDGASPHHLRVDVLDSRAYERIIRQGSVGLGESYADGWWDTDDLAAFLRLALRGLRPTHGRLDRFHRIVSPVVDPIARLRRASSHRDTRNVRTHYDLGNDFFRRVLDETMAYSCACFDSPETSLADASIAKFDRLAGMLDLQPGDRLLEIGTGWGGFALHAAQEYGCHVTTTTISARQYEFAVERVRAAGLDDRIDVLDAHYRDLRGTFDKAIAVEMIEAVDWREYDDFFRSVRGLLAPDGALVMQAIVTPDQSFDRLKRHTDFIKAAIFPGGCLPSVGALTDAAERAGGLTLAAHSDIGLHYGETLRRWRANLDRVAPELTALDLDARFARLWDFYFAYCEAGFDERYISATQLLYTTPTFAPRRQAAPRRPVRELAGAS
jgi:cyclopropane-fatty-acyl-phospholipid synthase